MPRALRAAARFGRICSTRAASSEHQCASGAWWRCTDTGQSRSVAVRLLIQRLAARYAAWE